MSDENKLHKKSNTKKFASLTIIGGIFFISMFIWGCSTEKNTFIRRSYHNLTAHYNVFFNGRESFKEGLEAIETNYQDNYTQVLPLFKYSDPEAVIPAASNMDKTIKKSSALISKHSITVKPKGKKASNKSSSSKNKKRKGLFSKNSKEVDFYSLPEYCKWVDDAYLLMGKAYFYKHDFFNAMEKFEFITKQYSMFPIKYDASLWMVRTYLETKKYSEAKNLLDVLEGDKDFPKKKEKEMFLLYADYQLKQKNYDDAISPLNQANELEKKKKLRSRYKFIIGQIHQKNGNYRDAARMYEDVIASNPAYDLAFNAKIRLAETYNLGAGRSLDIKRQLEKMLKDDKNFDYRDQIYYALAEIEKKENNLPQAIANYELSAQTSVSNDDQKAVAYLALADIYFERPDYELSGAYYDSCMTFLSEAYFDYERISLIANNLTDLITNLQEIVLQDSLQKIASLDQTARDEFIDNLIQQVIKAEEDAALKEKMDAESLKYDDGTTSTGLTPPTSGNVFYFYNQTTLNYGKSDFAKKWGKRKLEDNWRRINKSIVIGDEVGEIANGEDTTVLDNKSPDFYMQDLPLTDSLFRISDKKIADALMNTGKIYTEKLDDYPRAIEIYKNVLKRFNDGAVRLEALNNLFQLNKLIGNDSETEKYKNQIISEYPKSVYALAFTNPEYIAELRANEIRLNSLYSNAYQAFSSRQYQQTLSYANSAISEFPDNKYMSQFLYLKGIANGELNKDDIQQLKTEMTYIVDTYPDSDVAELAKKLLLSIRSGNLDQTEVFEYEYDAYFEGEKTYKEIGEGTHYYVLAIINKEIVPTRQRFNINRFCINSYSEKEFDITLEELTTELNIITVKSFSTKDEAMLFYNAIAEKPLEIYKGMVANDYKHFIISENNYELFATEKDSDKYQKFFNKFYLQLKK